MPGGARGTARLTARGDNASREGPARTSTRAGATCSGAPRGVVNNKRSGAPGRPSHTANVASRVPGGHTHNGDAHEDVPAATSASGGESGAPSEGGATSTAAEGGRVNTATSEPAPPRALDGSASVEDASEGDAAGERIPLPPPAAPSEFRRRGDAKEPTLARNDDDVCGVPASEALSDDGDEAEPPLAYGDAEREEETVVAAAFAASPARLARAEEGK